MRSRGTFRPNFMLVTSGSAAPSLPSCGTRSMTRSASARAPIASAASVSSAERPFTMWWSRTEAKPEIKPELRAMIDQHARIDWRNPPHDPERVKAAFERYLRELRLKRVVRWIADPAEVATTIKEGWDSAQANEHVN